MPEQFTVVQIGPKYLRSLSSQFISVHQHSPQFDSAAEVPAEVNHLRAVQGHRWCVNAEASRSGVAIRNDFSEVLVVT